MQFEVCVTNIASVIAADRAGAHRVELCAALDVGGVTPSIGLVRAAVQAGQIPVYVLIRVREGDFCYSDAELAVMLDDIHACREAGARGVVIGALQRDGRLHLPQMQALRAAAGALDVTCHRAFDSTPDPFAALDQLAELGYSPGAELRAGGDGLCRTVFAATTGGPRRRARGGDAGSGHFSGQHSGNC